VSFEPARLDLTARALTGAFFCALSLAVLLAFTGPRALIGLAAAMAGIAAGCALLAPRAYVIEDGGLTVRRALGAVRVDGPLRVEAVEQRQLMGSRLLGSGGLFGYLGMYRADGARYAAALTARDRAVLVTGREGGALVSPEDREALLALVSHDE
jgi:Bacterial PH domain